MKKFITLFSIAIFFGLVPASGAQVSPPDAANSAISAYRWYKDVQNISIRVPTVLEVPFPESFIERFDFAVFNATTNSFEPYFLKQETFINEIPVSVSAVPFTGSANAMIDKNAQTYADFPLPENTQGLVQVTLVSENLITSSSLTTLLDNNVALPTSVEIRALVFGENRIVLANKRMEQQTIRFPETSSNRWIITFAFSQPLRISEIRLNQENAKRASVRAVRFLAQPGHTYRVYFDPDRTPLVSVGESGNLAFAKDVVLVSAAQALQNYSYVIADGDADDIPDILDNCVSFFNPDQQDINGNGRGDVCDDYDQDGLMNEKDNCPNNPNRDQKDTDSDNIGDVCDTEESRITEKYAWIPWVGIGFAALVLVILFGLTARSVIKKDI